MDDLTIEQVNGLLRNTPFLLSLRDRAGTDQAPQDLKQAQAREAISAIAAIAGKAPKGLGYRLLLAKLAGALHSYLEAFNEDATTYLPEGSEELSTS